MNPRISVLLINLNNLDYTKNCFEYLVRQDALFNLKIVDQNSNEIGTKEYYYYGGQSATARSSGLYWPISS